jgi:pantoate--beta-alanine ligase
MELIEATGGIAAWSAQQRAQGRRVGFVPTMGALHEGHMALVQRALAGCEAVVASIFVNPLQFNNPEDLRHYPRQLGQDLALLEAHGCHAVFAPSNEGLYTGFTPRPYALGNLDEVLEGPSRPGHFQGVANVVERLFHYVRPDDAFFGS